MLAGLAASALTFPCEVARRRAMVGAAGERNPLMAMARIARNEGFFQGLYKGYAINMVKVLASRLRLEFGSGSGLGLGSG